MKDPYDEDPRCPSASDKGEYVLTLRFLYILYVQDPLPSALSRLQTFPLYL